MESFESGDGTLEGKLDYCQSQDTGEYESYATQANSELVIFWTGPWPELNFVKESASPETEVGFHMKSDLLHRVTICDLEDGYYYEPQADEFFDNVVVQFLIIEGSVMALMFLSLLAVDCYQVSPLTNWAALPISAALACCSMFGAVLLLKYFYDSGFSAGWVAAMFYLLAVEMLTWAWGEIVLWLFVGLTLGALFQTVRNVAFRRACVALDFLWIKKTYLTMAALFFFIMGSLVLAQGYL